jgi:hypothetical protein
MRRVRRSRNPQRGPRTGDLSRLRLHRLAEPSRRPAGAATITAVTTVAGTSRDAGELEREILTRIAHAGLHICETELRYQLCSHGQPRPQRRRRTAAHPAANTHQAHSLLTTNPHETPRHHRCATSDTGTQLTVDQCISIATAHTGAAMNRGRPLRPERTGLRAMVDPGARPLYPPRPRTSRRTPPPPLRPAKSIVEAGQRRDPGASAGSQRQSA